jgi:hypothetical protein
MAVLMRVFTRANFTDLVTAGTMVVNNLVPVRRMLVDSLLVYKSVAYNHLYHHIAVKSTSPASVATPSPVISHMWDNMCQALTLMLFFLDPSLS